MDIRYILIDIVLFQFRFSSAQDKILLALGIIAAMCGGCTMPVMIMLFGELTNAFVTNGRNMTEITEIFCGVQPTCCQINTSITS